MPNPDFHRCYGCGRKLLYDPFGHRLCPPCHREAVENEAEYFEMAEQLKRLVEKNEPTR